MRRSGCQGDGDGPSQAARGGLHESIGAGGGLAKEITIFMRCLCRAGLGARESTESSSVAFPPGQLCVAI